MRNLSAVHALHGTFEERLKEAVKVWRDFHAALRMELHADDPAMTRTLQRFYNPIFERIGGCKQQRRLLRLAYSRLVATVYAHESAGADDRRQPAARRNVDAMVRRCRAVILSDLIVLLNGLSGLAAERGIEKVHAVAHGIDRHVVIERAAEQGDRRIAAAGVIAAYQGVYESQRNIG